MRAKPFIKWAGGKRQLLPELRKLYPESFENYFEPFLGGGAVFFDLAPQHAVLNDINPAVTNLYQTIKDDAEGLIQLVSEIEEATPADKDEQKQYYYQLRSQFNEGLTSDTYDLKNAALFMVINHRCFNGLFRVNRSGEFNVPFNGSSRPSLSPENIHAAAESLANTEILTGDFVDACEKAKEGDFVFLDSPYAPLKFDSFTNYAKEGFGLEDHERLATLFRDLDARGCRVVMTNHDVPLIHQLYEGYSALVVPANRMINSNASRRAGSVEIIVRNWT
ncbi:DNA adenine methylase [Corynebacterium aquilae]|uniref:site-specific DNA-methyltransferase (adenine-specific) n=1 Tax=Corynebacterium aquilae DSM 44791 TaxID=1431546 RepID=A0A1L7CHV2_9CORY|nr:DNA adenine methylase [Corynebacterium aquilae]APT85430.1 DNA adenine methylase [Corynebacterium aquilae DSM 44791]